MKTAFFPAKTLSHLPGDNFEALAALCTEFERFDGHARQLPEHHDDYVEALSILRAFAMAREARWRGRQRWKRSRKSAPSDTKMSQAFRLTSADCAARSGANWLGATPVDILSP